jgi:phosphoglycerate dehydrogenase-like enzyme
VTICFAHAAYQMKARSTCARPGSRAFRYWAYDDLQKRVGEADVVVVSGMWKNDLIPAATSSSSSSRSARAWTSIPRSSSRPEVRLCECRGVNARAVAEHAHRADPGGGASAAGGARQSAQEDVARHDRRSHQREDELGGKTLLVVGMGRIGAHLAKLAKAFDMKVIGIRRDPAGANGADSIHGMRAGEAGAAGRHRGSDLRAHARDHRPDERGGLCRDEAIAMFVNVARGKVATRPP